ncbi:acyl carrier protein 1 [Pyrus ussuriensis x Pyrus communis]|uniref:Acyl carrier protein 1 n=1 Tax=Pyrus ussuriensis x Pyrus communis TaxID=2448454 RepID=A0A5N5HR67_9ROSA|nr:acyl carrier protein 1 [Pyrus ussuriensis x Pyrus communis]
MATVTGASSISLLRSSPNSSTKISHYPGQMVMEEAHFLSGCSNAPCGFVFPALYVFLFELFLFYA